MIPMSNTCAEHGNPGLFCSYCRGYFCAECPAMVNCHDENICNGCANPCGGDCGKRYCPNHLYTGHNEDGFEDYDAPQLCRECKQSR